MTSAKPLDANTARDTLQKAGEDKAKARQMAKDAGYQFWWGGKTRRKLKVS